MSVKKMLMVASAVTIIFVQEQLLLMLPNVQFTVLLIILFSSIFTFRESIIMIVVYVFLDSMYMGTLDFFYMTPMLIGWSIIPFSYNYILRKTNNEYVLATFALSFGFIYGWTFIPFRMIQFGISEAWPYLVADLPFEIIMGIVSFGTVLLAYKPLKNVLNQLSESENYSTIKAK